MEWKEFTDWCDELIMRLGAVEHASDAGWDFANSIQPKIERMRDWALTHQGVSKQMVASVKRYEEGVEKWEQWL
jgi:hypothetical protein